MKEFAALHNHSDGSLLDGVVSPKRMLETAKGRGIKAVAFTDHGTCTAHLEAQIEAAMIEDCPKVIFGSEFYVVDNCEEKQKGEKRRHLVLMAKNEVGYKNLIKLNNEAWRHFYYNPRIDFDLLAANKEGLIATSACAKGVIGYYVINDDRRTAINNFHKYQGLFGDDFYLETQLIHIKDPAGNIQVPVNDALMAMSKRVGTPMIITNDTHYLNEGDHILHEKVLHLSGGYGFVFSTQDLWLKTWDELNSARLAYYPAMDYRTFQASMENTLEIAEKCNHHIPVGGVHIPPFEHTEHEEYAGEKTKQDFFVNLTSKALKKFLRDNPKADVPVYRARLAKELRDIIKMGAIDYFLIVEDLVRFIRGKGKLVVIRGSANGSLICYLLKFGHIDPVKIGILFERFINPARVESGMFDVDIDIDMEREMRPIAVEYLKGKYSEHRICNVGSYSRLKWKAAIKDMGRVMAMEAKTAIKHIEEDALTSRERALARRNLERHKAIANRFSFQEMNRVTKMLETAGGQGTEVSIEESIKASPDFAKWWAANQDWVERFVEPVVGIRKSPSIHPASVVILPSHMDDWLPIRSQTNPHKKGERILCTQWEGSHGQREDLRTYGVMALDILGVKTLNVVAETMRMVANTRGVELSLDTLPFDDKNTIEHFKTGETLGVFQLGAPHITRIVKSIQPDCFEDVINLMAIDRPGALANQAHVAYAKRKHGEEPIKRYHPTIDKILSDALGIPLFNEHIMMIAQKFAGFTPLESEELRVISKAKKGEAAVGAFEEKFKKQAVIKHGIQVSRAAEEIWEQIISFGAYSFPKAHASSYGLISWATMFLKVNYSVEFFCNLLNYADHDDYLKIWNVAKSHYNLELEMPEINDSEIDFSLKDGKVVWALRGIKNIGGNTLLEIAKHRPYTSFEDFFTRANKRSLNKIRMESLILAGCFRNFGGKLALMRELHRLRDVDRKAKKVKKTEPFSKEYSTYKDEDWKRIESDYLGFQTIGMYELYKNRLPPDTLTVAEFERPISGQRVTVFGQLGKCYVRSSEKAGTYMTGRIFDTDGNIQFFMWSDAYERFKKRDKKLKEGDVVVITGTKKTRDDDSSIFVDRRGSVKIL